ncbi:MAG TPA: hypothetical protein VGI64_17670 [Streptosporangiaceae bacterium]
MRISQWTAGVAAVVVVAAVAVGVVSQLGPPRQVGTSVGLVTAPADSTTSPPPVVLPTDPFLGDRCAMGWSSSSPGAVFALGKNPGGQTVAGTYLPPVQGYLLKLVNDSSHDAEVTGFSVAFFNELGEEISTDTEQWPDPKFLAPGQSLSWIEEAGADLGGNLVAGGNASVPPNAITCQLATWASPQSTPTAAASQP